MDAENVFGVYEDRTGTQLIVSHLVVPPHGTLEVSASAPAIMGAERWERFRAALLVSVARGSLQRVEVASLPQVAGTKVTEAVEEEEEVESLEENPFLAIDPHDVQTFLALNYQTMKKKLKTITSYDLLGKYLSEAARQSKSEAIIKAITGRMQELRFEAAAKQQGTITSRKVGEGDA